MRDERDWYELLLAPRYRGPCKARCAQTGLKCQLPAHGPKTPHASERGKFTIAAATGQTYFPVAELRDELATAQGFDVGELLRGAA